MKTYIIIMLCVVVIVMVAIVARTINDCLHTHPDDRIDEIGEIITSSIVLLAYICALVFMFLLKTE
jgi:hypothetical protein